MNDEGRSKGAAFVYMGSAEEAQKVVSSCKNEPLTLEGQRAFVQISRQ
jgi:hypothetical protein